MGFAAVLDSLNKYQLLQEPTTFAWVARQQQYPTQVKAGRYRLDPHLGNLDLVKMLAAGHPGKRSGLRSGAGLLE